MCPMSAQESRLRTVPSPFPPWLSLLLWLALCAGAGYIGSIASASAPDFYAQLQKPRWAPPAGVFGPVWTLLYIAMAVSAWLVWRERGWTRARAPLGLFVVQLALNALWSWLFFHWRQGGLAFADILFLLALIIATLTTFARIRRLAAWLLVPYLGWVSYATALSYSVWQRNPQLL